MFQKVRFRLTALFTGVAASLLIVLSAGYLYVSENALKESYFSSFKNDMNTIVTHLEQQTVITMEWLSKMEAQGNYSFYFLDNEIPFLYTYLNGFSEKSLSKSLPEEALTAYQNAFQVSLSDEAAKSASPYLTYHVEYEFFSPTAAKNFFSSYVRMERSASPLQVIVLMPEDKLVEQITEQRRRFLIIDISACFLLALFSWFFTGRLLRPIQENQKKQLEFIASASHELRTPLAVILSASECCKNAPPEQKEGFLNTIASESKRMSLLVNDMLTLSRTGNSQFSIHPKPVELDTLLIDCYDAFLPLAGEKKQRLALALPEEAAPKCICDPERIRQVISILLHNAVSYTPEGGSIHISLSLRPKGHGFCIAVSDNGAGISDADKKKIFDRFYRAEKARSAKGHFGLGLAIAYEIVKAHRGSIAVSDSESGGSCFTVTLPAKRKP